MTGCRRAVHFEGCYICLRLRVFFIAVSVVTARYGAVPTSLRGIVRGVSETGVLRRYGEDGRIVPLKIYFDFRFNVNIYVIIIFPFGANPISMALKLFFK